MFNTVDKIGYNIFHFITKVIEENIMLNFAYTYYSPYIEQNCGGVLYPHESE